MSAVRVILAALVFGTASAKPAPVAPAEPFSLTGTIVGVVETIMDVINKIPILSDVQAFAVTFLSKAKDWVETYVIVDDIKDAINITKTAAAVLLTIVVLLTVVNGLALLVNAVKDYLEGFLYFPKKVPLIGCAMPLEQPINNALNKFKAWDLREIVPLVASAKGVKPTMAKLTNQLLEAVTLAVAMAAAANAIGLVETGSPTQAEVTTVAYQIGVCLAIQKFKQ